MESSNLPANNQKIADFVVLLSRCQSTEQAYQLFQQHAAMLGFEHSLYCTLYAPSEAPENTLYTAYDNYPQPFLEAYYELEIGGLAADITMDWCVQSSAPLVWEGPLYQKLVKDNACYQQQNHLSHDFGVKYGFTKSFDTGPRLSQSMIGLSATHIGEREFNADILPNIDLAQVFCHYLDSFIRSLPRATLFGQAPHTNLQRLTPAERNTLQWLATGHSIRTIADEKLYRSVSSINHHISSAKTKLKAANRSQLIARAVLLGLVDPL